MSGDGEKWYYDVAGEAQGPLPPAEIRARIVRGEIGPHQMVYCRRMGQWAPASAVAELREAFRPKAGPAGYYVGVRGTAYGPYGADRMREMIRGGRLQPASLIWGADLAGWTRLERVAEFAGDLAAAGAAPAAAGAAGAEEAVEEMWYVQHGEVRRGPMSLDEIVQACRGGRVRASDRVWSNRLDGWRDAAQVPELTDSLRAGEVGGQGELWYYRTAEGMEGPLSLEDLRDFVEQRLIGPAEQVYSKSLGAWTEAQKVPGLQPALEAARLGLAEADRQARRWYFRTAGRERGPVAERFLVEQIVRRSLKAQDEVFGPGAAQWRRVCDVPELARYCDAREMAAALAEEMSSRGRRRAGPARRRVLPWALSATALIAGIAAAALLLGRGQTPWRGAGGGAPKAPGEPAEVARAWLELCLAETGALSAQERREAERKLAALTAGGRLDVQSADLRALLAASTSPVQAEESSGDIVRAADPESFCYAVGPVAGAGLRVQALRPSEQDPSVLAALEKTFSAGDFAPVRRVAVRRGSAAAAVLLVQEQGQWRVAAFGRAALVGAASPEARVRSVTGRRSAQATEAQALLRTGIERAAAGGGSAEWGAYGDLMSVDASLVPPAVIELRTGAPLRETLVVRASSGATLQQVRERFGEPQLTVEMDLSAAPVRIVSVGPTDGTYYTRVTAAYYGSFALAADPASGRIVGYVFGAAAP